MIDVSDYGGKLKKMKIFDKIRVLGASALGFGAYNATYVSADLDDIVIDFLGTYLAQIRQDNLLFEC